MKGILTFSYGVQNAVSAVFYHNFFSTSYNFWRVQEELLYRATNLNLNSKELNHFAELELEKLFFLNSNLNSHKTVRVH